MAKFLKPRHSQNITSSSYIYPLGFAQYLYKLEIYASGGVSEHRKYEKLKIHHFYLISCRLRHLVVTIMMCVSKLEI